VALREVPGVVQSVLTGNIQPDAFTKVSAFGLREHLDFEVGGYGSDDIIRAHLVAVAQKRAGARYSAVLDRSNTVLIGDTPRDVEAGKRGGARSAALTEGSRPGRDLAACISSASGASDSWLVQR
jgi:phosphoglycolate phosphatase